MIYEGLRMQIPFSGLLMKQVPPEGDTLADGRFVPGGTRIAHNTLAIQRRRDIFGEDADVFRPERWLDGVSPEQRQRMVQTTELVFGYGRWGCLGKPVAFLELQKVFVEVSFLGGGEGGPQFPLFASFRCEMVADLESTAPASLQL